VITPTQAAALNLAPLAGPYAENEIGILTQAALTLGEIRHAIVIEPDGLHLWRDKHGMRLHVTPADE